MKFIETRGNEASRPLEVEFAQTVLSPSASFGGLYAPKEFPQLGVEFLQAHLNSDYKQLARALFVACELGVDDETLSRALATYDGFDDERVVPVEKVGDNLYICELYHGPTRAFKDMALQPFGVIFSHFAIERGENYLVMTATSGDTGPAALKTFENKPNVKVVCLYPEGGTSQIQKLQMVTQTAKNLKVIGVDGSFDDAQSALKNLLASSDFAARLASLGYKVSAANSVNFGRIAFQTVYHIYSYLQLVRQGEIKMGETIDLVVPSGNFGNALGGYYAKKMGVPLGRIAIASNANNVLTQLIEQGVYDLNDKKLVKTISPAMDILISSNIERLLFDKFGAQRTRELMESLAKNRRYELTSDELAAIREDFVASWGDDDYASSIIKRYADVGYLMDPHTALCLKGVERLSSNRKVVAYSTAEWTKFAPDVYRALGEKTFNGSDKEAIELIRARFDCKLHADIEALLDVKMPQTKALPLGELEKEIETFLG